MLDRRIHQIVDGAGSMGDAVIRLDYRRGYPAAVNAVQETELSAAAALDVADEANVDRAPPPIMAAEDFAFMLQARPGAIIHVGIGGGEQGRQLHTPIFDFNDEALPIGASYWARLVERLLPRL